MMNGNIEHRAGKYPAGKDVGLDEIMSAEHVAFQLWCFQS